MSKVQPPRRRGERTASPYLAPGFYDRALAAGRHREITGGWWEETGRLQLSLLRRAGMEPQHRLLDIGCGALRLGRHAVPYLAPGHYWGTDASAALMQRGREVELDAAARARLPPAQLVADADFAFPSIPAVDFAIAWGVFTHLPPHCLPQALHSLRRRFPQLRAALLTLFLAEDPPAPGRPVTHATRAPWHRPAAGVLAEAQAAGFAATLTGDSLPRGQRLMLLA